MKGLCRLKSCGDSRRTIFFVLALVLIGAIPGRGATRQMLHGHVPAIVSRLARLGRLQSSQHLSLAISLPLRNQAALTDLLRELSDPSSPNYRHYLTPAQFTEKFGPSEQDYQAVIKFAKANNLNVTATHSNRVLLDVEGAVPEVEKAFHVTMWNYQHPTEGRRFYAPSSEPSVDLGVSILSIGGLNNYSLPQPRLKLKAVSAKAPAGRILGYPQVLPNFGSAPNTGSGPGGNYMGNDFRTAYAPNVSLTGGGQTVGLVQFDGYTAGDITYYESLTGRPNVTLTNVLLDGFTGAPSGTGGEVEVSLDIEMAISMAPGISRVILYEAGPNGNWYDILNRIVTDNAAKQIGCSWYSPGQGADATADQIFQQMAAQGQSFFSASGDNDAFTGLIPFPGDTPYITEVGGTMLSTSGAGGAYASEAVWNRNNGVGTGGGISTQYAIPTWQQGISMSANLGSNTMRNVPDVALTAESVYVRADGLNYSVGGTSCAAPLWAGFTALVNQQAMVNTGTTVGFVNPAIYAIGKNANYATDFHDTVTGNNFSSTSPARFPGAAGYDLCTGWGTPKGAALISALAGPPAPIITNGPPSSPIGLGIGYTFSFTAFGHPTPTFSLLSGALPSGLNLSSLGVISGTPSQLGSFTATVDATNGIAPDATQTFTIVVQSPFAPTFTDGPPPAMAQVGSAYSFSYTASGAPTPTFALNSGSLPPGLTLTSNGLLSGVPSQTGIFSGRVSASNGVGSPVTQSFSITVQQAPAITNGPPPSTTTLGTAYNFTYTATGSPIPTFSLGTGSLPPGVALSSSGVLSGTTTQAGTFTGTVTASNGLNPSASQAFSITVQALSAPAFANAPLNTVLIVNSSLSFPYKSNGNPSSTFQLTSGTLPLGMQFSSSGVLSGAPTQIGVYSGTITASNGISPNATQNYRITVFNNLVQQYSILHNFGDGSVANDGNSSWAPLILGSDGNFYGTTVATGSATNGIAFMVTPQGAEAVLHTFSDSSVPNVGRGSYSALLQASDGNFYGTTCYGGDGGGGVYKMTPQGAVTLLHLFGDGSVLNDGSSPFAPLIQGTDGNFYGTTDIGGSAGEGTVFMMTPLGAVTILHSFGDGSVANDGANVRTALIQGSDGNFYGTSYLGGSANNGIIFRVTPQGGYSIIHSFGDGTVANDGIVPLAPLIQGTDGNLYGTTYQGGTVNYGIVFKMTLQGSETILHNFYDGSASNDAYGAQVAALMQGNDGNFYGTTPYGGGQINGGALFRMTPQGAVTVLHSFGTITNDGEQAVGGLVQGTDGGFYGTTLYGGTGGQSSGGYGTVFKLTLGSPPTLTSLASATFVVGQAGSFAVIATGSPIFSASGLPSWANLDPVTGLLSGTPPNNAAGTFPVTLTATNGISPDAVQAFTLTVNQAPTITSGSFPSSALSDANFNFAFAASGYPAPTFSISSGALPPGLTLSTAGVVSGTPTSTGTYSFTVTASNGFGTDASQSFTINITDPGQTVATDTPTMPQWGLALLAVLLVAIASGSLPKRSRSEA